MASASPELRVNPRWLFAVALLLLIGAVVRLALREVWPPAMDFQSAESGMAAEVKPDFAPWPAVGEHLQAYHPKLPGNVFHSTEIDKYLARVAAEKAAAAEAARKAAAEAARKAAEEAARKAAEEAARKAAEEAAKKGAEAPQPPPPPPIIELSYHGMWQKTDGERLALLEIRPPPQSRFYSVGEVCLGMVVTNIERDSVGLIGPDGTNRPLVPGAVLRFQEGKLLAP